MAVEMPNKLIQHIATYHHVSHAAHIQVRTCPLSHAPSICSNVHGISLRERWWGPTLDHCFIYASKTGTFQTETGFAETWFQNLVTLKLLFIP